MKDNLILEISTACGDISHQIALKSQAMADRIGLSPSDFEHLSLLILGGPTTAGNLAVLSGLTTGAVTGVIDRLEEAGLAQRQRDRVDRRRIIVAPTKQAVQQMQEFHKKMDKDFAVFLSNYSPSQLSTILTFLRTTTDLVHAETVRIKQQK